MEAKAVQKIEVSATVRETYETKAMAVWTEYGKPHTYGQDLDTITKVRVLRDIDPGFGPESKIDGGRYSDAEWAQIVQTLKHGSNANAINNNLKATKSTKAVRAASEYAGIV